MDLIKDEFENIKDEKPLRMGIIKWLLGTLCLFMVGFHLTIVKGEELNDSSISGAEILKKGGVTGGLIVHVGCGNGKLTLELCANKRTIVHGLTTKITEIEETREFIKKSGLYGSVSIALWNGKTLPYTDNLVNLLVVGDEGVGLTQKEITRVLCPLGIAYVKKSEKWTKIQKDWPKNVDEWSHHRHGPDGNPVARDEVVGPPKSFQWLQAPLWMRGHETDSSISCMVTSKGRLFYMEDCAPASLTGQNGLPDYWHLMARDAFNGILLWKIPIKEWGWREWKKVSYAGRGDNFPVNIHYRVVAAGDVIYATLGYRAAVSQLDAATGKVLNTYKGTEGCREILFQNGQLILTVPNKDKLKLMVLDPSTGNVVWQTKPIYGGTKVGQKQNMGAILNPAADDEVVCFINGSEIVSLHRRNGKVLWEKKLQSSSGKKKKSRNSGELQAGLLIISDGVILYCKPGKPSTLYAFATQDGKELWNKPTVKIGMLWFIWKDVFVIDGIVWTWMDRTRNPVTVQGFDLKTGALVKKIEMGNVFKVDHHHRCYSNRATSNYILASRRGTEFVNLKGGEHTVCTWVRGTCHLGMIPANGLHYATPHPCKCYYYEQLNGLLALSSSASKREADSVESRFDKGEAYGKISKTEAAVEDWVAFRANYERSCSTKATIPAKMIEKIWEWKSDLKLSAPIAVGDSVYFSAVDAHTVYALNAGSGAERWHFIADGRIDTPPAYYKGMLFFGTRNGTVYCLRATDGILSWKFRAAPQERLIGAFNQIESAWPVYGAVLVKEGIVYLTAGRSSHLDGGIHVYALDSMTGKVLHQSLQEGPKTDLTDSKWHEAGGKTGPGSRSDLLQSAGDYIHMRHLSFDKKLNPGKDINRIRVKGGFLDDTYFQRVYCYFGSCADGAYKLMINKKETKDSDFSKFYNSKGLSQILIEDEKNIYGTRMFDQMRLLNAWNYFRPADKGYTLFAVDKEKRNTLWSVRVPIRVKAMAVSADFLALAGAPDIVDEKDPLGAFEGRKGALLRVISRKTGEKLSQMKLVSPPVLNGIAVVNNKLFLALRGGKLICIGNGSSR